VFMNQGARTSVQHEPVVRTSAHEPRGRTNLEHEPIVRTSAHEPRGENKCTT
jgi:hypothetical protein